MIRRVHIWNIGPITDKEFIFDPSSPTVLIGRSETGKGSLMEAVSYCIFGKWSNGDAFPTSSIRAGAKGLAIEIELMNGTILRRTLTAGGSKKRVIVRGGETTPFTSDEEFYAAIPTPIVDGDDDRTRAMKSGFARAWANQDLVRFFMFPQERVWAKWFTGNGREVRDILLSAVPGCSIASVVVEEMKKAGYEQDPKGILPEDQAAKVVTACNRAASMAEGSKTAAETSKSDADAALAAAEGSFNEEAFRKEKADAQKVLDVEKEWVKHIADHTQWFTACRAIDDAQQACDDWNTRKSAIGAEPDAKAKEALESAKAELPAAKEKQNAAANEWKRINALLTSSREELARANAAEWPGDKAKEATVTRLETSVAALTLQVQELPSDDSCPTCGAKEWEGAKEKRANLEKDLAHARDLHAAAIKELEGLKAQYEIERDTHVATCEAAITKQEADLAAARTDYDAKKAAVDAILKKVDDIGTAAQTRITWEASVKALGDEPKRGGEKPKEPKKPATARPTPDALAEARAVTTKQRPNLDALRATVATAAQRLKDASTALAEAEAKAKRAKALLDAVRAAPSIVANRVSAFESIGGMVKVTFDTNSTTLQVKDREIWMPYDKGPSDGRRLVADYVLRDFLRTKSRLPLPVFVNGTESWKSKDPFPAKGNTILLLNEDCDLQVKE